MALIISKCVVYTEMAIRFGEPAALKGGYVSPLRQMSL